ncbi:MAG: membrane integrity-associated transporter subunit PqiC [Planctomycetota bacterium]
MSWRIVTASLLVSVVSSGCTLLAPRADPTRFLVLASTRELSGEDAARADGTRATSSASLGLGPIRLPEYLERAELMVRTSATELTPSRVGRWAEPFGAMLTRVLADDFVQLLAPERLVVYPWYATDRPQWQVEIDVVRLEPDSKGEVVLLARWSVRELASAGRTFARESRHAHTAERDDPASIAAAMSAVVSRLAQEIAGVPMLAERAAE